jgi:RNA polymerase sigma-70 factor, ECF subfamily
MAVVVASIVCGMALRDLAEDARGHPEQSRRMTDGELVDQVRAGDAAAFGELVERHRGAVYRAALAALGNEADAEDTAQEALVLAYRRIHQFRGDASVRTWMISIAWRLSLSRRRRLSWKVRRMVTPAAELDGLRSTVPSADVRLQKAEMMAIVRRHIRQLPPKLRDALLLAAAGDLTQDELAEALNVPPSTFRGRLRDARLRLKKALGTEI